MVEETYIVILKISYGATNCGLFYSNGQLILNEIFGILFIAGWVGAVMTPFFYVLNMLGMFRVDPLEEKVGLDISHHKGAAYDLSAPDAGDVRYSNPSTEKDI